MRQFIVFSLVVVAFLAFTVPATSASTRVKRQYYGGMYGGYASPYGMGYNPYTFATYPNMYGGYGGYGAGYGAGYGTGYGGYGGYGMYSGMGYGLYGK